MPHPCCTDGLYDPRFEHDACGVGFLCHLSNEPSHAIVQQGLDLLIRLAHRGACGCDARTGDGAGILIQVPHAFFAARCPEVGIHLPEAGQYGVGMVFLPQDAAPRARLQALFEQVVAEEGQAFLGWRRVPTDATHIGTVARTAEPTMWHAFVGNTGLDRAAFERKLYVIRNLAEHRARTLPDSDDFYMASLSTRTLVYKGMLMTDQLGPYFPDLTDPLMASAMAMVHSRFATNTLPRWPLAQPFRFLSHNGEINTLRGNVNWMKAREAVFHSKRFGDDMQKLLPILNEEGSDSLILDNALELLYFTGRSLPHAMMMLVPEAWEHHEAMDDDRRAFYEYHACLMEPWDGPATLPFTDGRYLGAMLDRNGLRPSRYTITKDGYVVLASEAGVLDINPANVQEKGRLQPGHMFLVDLEEHRVVPDAEIKAQMAARQPYRQWLADNLVELKDLPAPSNVPKTDRAARPTLRRLFGYTLEDLRIILGPMGRDAKEPLGSMGNDTALAVLSDQPRPLYDYFKQRFAQVTNPPLDAIREKIITSLYLFLGGEGDLFQETPQHACQVRLRQPILTNADLARLRAFDRTPLRTITLDATFDPAGEGRLASALERLSKQAAEMVSNGYGLLILSDRKAGPKRAPIPALLATGAVHHHLIRTKQRTRCSLIVESGEPREVHHLAALIGYGASAINPYLALDSVRELAERGDLGDIGRDEAETHFIKAAGKGLLKVMSKMGISTLQSYHGAQIFEAVGLADDVVDRYFNGTISRIGGIGLEEIGEEVRINHSAAFPPVAIDGVLDLPVGGRYQWRRGGEHHVFNPMTVATLQHAVRQKDPATYAEYAASVNEQNQRLGTLRGLFDFVDDPSRSISLDEVEPWTEIVKRFKTGAMSYGSISSETHETLAEAMNEIGGRSNTGEGGEDPSRYAASNPKRSRIKQVASGRFGVTISYLASADEIQIKMAQGAKPGEGGQLPGKKVYPWIAKTRHSTPYVGLISPPPHHDIYSIEDLAQLIHDLKNANPEARVSVKLVSEAGVGTIAAGVAKGKADVILISGHDGGTGASPQTSIMHAGMPWELGLAETHQTLVRNALRRRVRIECDGQLKTGRDVAMAALLGADEFGFATAPLVALGCIMMRKCHLNTCPVGIATQDPVLREKFTGQPEHVINYFHFVAEELRAIMARLGYRTLEEMVGQVEHLRQRDDITHWKARHLNLAPVLHRPITPEIVAAFDAEGQDHGLAAKRDHGLIEAAQPALKRQRPVEIVTEITNGDRTFGTMLSHAVARKYGCAGLPDDTITIRAQGAAGQSFAAFGAPGITFHLTGEANDYVGKGLSGARIVITPPENAGFVPHENIIIGNVALYGATSGEVFIRGRVGERFGVRNSGVRAVVEGIGDHGCEYMTGGRVVVLGPTGRNFAAGMSGGIAYVLDGTHDFRQRRCNLNMVDLEPLDQEDMDEVHELVERHLEYTGSDAARWVLDNWDVAVSEFVKVMPVEYRNALQRLEAEEPAVTDIHVAA